MRAENASSVVDGNAIAGLLAELFAQDMTMMTGTCGGCGAAEPLAQSVVELDEIAAIVRCRSCTHTLFTVLRDGERLRLRIGSLVTLEGP
ncbi:hypothetical protein BJ991_002367 [Microbacterium immunditiarum]|uniref:Uncharacterized protein n=2 Tax=Microbacterium immunditiarum TaxID=337480 RepID=A0A7Y9GPS5_9MICO|nr:hypothetical protein [Microbacterium immunditiarum]